MQIEKIYKIFEIFAVLYVSSPISTRSENWIKSQGVPKELIKFSKLKELFFKIRNKHTANIFNVILHFLRESHFPLVLFTYNYCSKYSEKM